MKRVLFSLIVLTFAASPALGQWGMGFSQLTASNSEIEPRNTKILELIDESSILDKRVPQVQIALQNAKQQSASMYAIGPRQISIIDLGAKKVIATRPVDVGNAGMEPWIANHYFDGSNIWIPAGKSVLILDATTFEVKGRVSYNSKPILGLAVHPTLSVAYVVLSKENRISIVDKGSYKQIGSIKTSEFPCDIDITPDGKLVFVPTRDSRAGTVHAIDTETNRIIGATEVGEGTKPWMLTISPDGKYIYTENIGDGTTAVIEIPSMRVIKKIPAGKTPALNEFTPDGKFVYQTIRGDSVVNVYDVSTHSLVKKIKVGSKPIQMAIDPDGSEVYIANTGDNTISVIDTKTNEVIKSIPLGHKPVALLIKIAKP